MRPFERLSNATAGTAPVRCNELPPSHVFPIDAPPLWELQFSLSHCVTRQPRVPTTLLGFRRCGSHCALVLIKQFDVFDRSVMVHLPPVTIDQLKNSGRANV
jgi:hypothetical protein